MRVMAYCTTTPKACKKLDEIAGADADSPAFSVKTIQLQQCLSYFSSHLLLPHQHFKFDHECVNDIIFRLPTTRRTAHSDILLLLAW